MRPGFQVMHCHSRVARRLPSALLLAALAASLFASTQLRGQEESPTVQLRIVGANPGARSAIAPAQPVPPYFLFRGAPRATAEQVAAVLKAWYLDIYPGIDLIVYDNGYELEYFFVLAPGADPALIRLAFEGPQNQSLTPAGSILYQLPDAEIIQSAPVIILRRGERRTQTRGDYTLDAGRIIRLRSPEALERPPEPLNGSRFNRIPGGGQPGGPTYDFFMDRLEITHEQFLRFLNAIENDRDASENPTAFFDRYGHVWIHPDMKTDRDELFDLGQSSLTYDRRRPMGTRYDHHRNASDKSTPFASHPVSGVSWFGAVKYCNWLTVFSGRGMGETCYREGTNALDWAPVSATNWMHGTFGEAERRQWLQAKGFRLPMVNTPFSMLTTNQFGEFYKAAAWNGFTNRQYAFGRDVFDGTDANCRETIGRKEPSTLPAGFFDGKGFLGKLRTQPNANYYNIFDLTGNAAEWLNDFPSNGVSDARVVGGGAWNRALRILSAGESYPPQRTWAASGLRPVTTFMKDESTVIHILFTFFMEGGGAPTGGLEEAGAAIPETLAEEPEEAVPPAPNVLKATTDDRAPEGIDYKDQPEAPDVVPPDDGPGGDDDDDDQPPGPPGPPGPPSPAFTNTLTVQSVNPDAGVPIRLFTTDVDGATDGNTTFQRRYLRNSWVDLRAPTNAAGNVFVRWLVDGVPYTTNPNLHIRLTQNMTVTAVYSEPPIIRTLTVNSENPNSMVPVSVSTNDIADLGDGVTTFVRHYMDGTPVTLTAAPEAAGNVFVRWYRGDPTNTVSTNRTISVLMDTDISLTAVYEPSPGPYRLIVRSSNPSVGVLIDATPDINAQGPGATPYSRIYNAGTPVTVTAPPTAGGNVFQKWQLDGVDYSFTRTTLVTMDANHTLLAIYVYDPNPIPDPDVSQGGL